MRRNTPKYCSNCRALALARSDGQNLCAGCLMAAMLSARDPSIIEQVIPLNRPSSQLVEKNDQLVAQDQGNPG